MQNEEDRALFQVPCGMFVLTAQQNGRDNGCIINTVLQSTNTPNGLIVIVNKKTLTHEMIKGTGRWTASALAEDAPFSLFEHFGMVSGREKDKFKDYADCERAKNGLLYLTREVSAMFSCEVEQTMDLGTHTLFAGKMTQAMRLSDKPTMTYSEYREHVKPKEKAAKGWRCVVCGYVYEGEELPEDFVCPWCQHGANDFERIE